MSTVELKPRWRIDADQAWGRYEPVPSSRPRPWEDSYELIEDVPAEPIAGRDVMKFARVMHVTPYLALRERPDKSAPEIAQLKFNDRVFVVRALSTPSAWSFVVTDDRKFGYVWDEWLFLDPPEPNAWLHKIAPGESAIGIAQKYYKGATGWGHDYRFYVNVLVYTNRGEGDKRKGIAKDNKDDSWSATKTKAGVYIWVPSVAFADTLRGQVSSGSITYGAWELVRDIAATVWDWATFGVAFVAGLIHGALESVWDVFTGIIDLANLIVDLVKVVLEGPIAKAQELWDSLSLDVIKEAIGDWIDDFEKKWNAASSLKRGHFRGWVIGYLIAEVAMAIFSAGTVTAVKWAGRLGRIAKALKKIKGLGKVIDKAEEVAKKAKGKLDELLKRDKGKQQPTTTTRKFEYPTAQWMRKKLDDYSKRPGRTWKTTGDIDHTIKRHAHGSPGGSAKKPVQKFPADWTNDDILEAGYRVANDPGVNPERIGREASRDYYRGEYKGERVRVQVDRESQSIVSVAPERTRIDPESDELFIDEDDAPSPATSAPAVSGAGGTATPVQAATVEIILIDAKGLVPKGVHKRVMTALARDLNAIYATEHGKQALEQNFGATFTVSHRSKDTSREERRGFGKLQYPIYFANAHSSNALSVSEIETIIADHGIPDTGKAADLYEQARDAWKDKAVEGFGIPPLRGYRKLGFIKVDVVNQARGEFETTFLNILKHELGHMFNITKHSDGVMRRSIVLADESLGYTEKQVSAIVREIARLRATKVAQPEAEYEYAIP